MFALIGKRQPDLPPQQFSPTDSRPQTCPLGRRTHGGTAKCKGANLYSWSARWHGSCRVSDDLAVRGIGCARLLCRCVYCISCMCHPPSAHSLPDLGFQEILVRGPSTIVPAFVLCNVLRTGMLVPGTTFIAALLED